MPLLSCADDEGAEGAAGAGEAGGAGGAAIHGLDGSVIPSVGGRVVLTSAGSGLTLAASPGFDPGPEPGPEPGPDPGPEPDASYAGPEPDPEPGPELGPEPGDPGDPGARAPAFAGGGRRSCMYSARRRCDACISPRSLVSASRVASCISCRIMSRMDASSIGGWFSSLRTRRCIDTTLLSAKSSRPASTTMMTPTSHGLLRNTSPKPPRLPLACGADTGIGTDTGTDTDMGIGAGIGMGMGGMGAAGGRAAATKSMAPLMVRIGSVSVASCSYAVYLSCESREKIREWATPHRSMSGGDGALERDCACTAAVYDGLIV